MVAALQCWFLAQNQAILINETQKYMYGMYIFNVMKGAAIFVG